MNERFPPRRNDAASGGEANDIDSAKGGRSGARSNAAGRPTMTDIAMAAGVSQTTVSLVLNDAHARLSGTTRSRVVPDRRAWASLRTSETVVWETPAAIAISVMVGRPAAFDRAPERPPFALSMSFASPPEAASFRRGGNLSFMLSPFRCAYYHI